MNPVSGEQDPTISEERQKSMHVILRDGICDYCRKNRQYVSSLCSQPAQSNALHKHTQKAVGVSPSHRY